METKLADWFKNTPDGIEADAILRACVHCGFCTATCPTYQILGDENDGPRGRIYLMKQVMEGERPTMATMTHLDRCLTCRNCETTCPSGVRYGRLVDIGRKLVEERVERPLAQQAARKALREGLTRRWLFDPAMRIGKMVRPLLPEPLKGKVPDAPRGGRWPVDSHLTKVLLLNSCTQGAMMPGIDAATARVLDRLEVQVLVEPRSGCCGAIRYHLNDHDGGLDDARRNVDAWWPYLEAGVEAIVMNASGCGVMVKEYGHLLRNDPAYAERAAKLKGHVVVGGSNYGQGSSREHAALGPEYLGLRAVLAKGFARIHAQNLVNFGVLPLTFVDSADYDSIETGDVLRMAGLRGALEKGYELTIENVTRRQKFQVRHAMSPRQVQLMLRGGLINWMKEQLAHSSTSQSI